MRIELTHAKARLRELVEAARDEDVILMDDDKPVARIIPIAPMGGTREFGSARGLVEIADDFDHPLAEFCDYA